MTQRLTKSLVDRMQLGDTLWDDLKGFGVRSQGRTPVYFVKTRINGRQRFITIGKHGTYTVEQARQKARRLLTAARDGDDIARHRAEERNRLSLRDLAPIYLEEYGTRLKPRTLVEYRRLFERTILPAFGSRRVDDITKGDVARFHSGLARTPRKANFAVACLSSCMTWAIENGYTRPDLQNPCRTVPLFRESNRERYLTEDEIDRLFTTLDAVDAERAASASVTAAIRLLLLTGARHSEITTLKWEYVDFDRGMIWLPDSKTGRKPIHLNAEAVEILRHHPRDPDNPYVIQGHRHGTHLVNLWKPWYMICDRANLTGVRLHDLRHTHASLAINNGASLYMVGKLLGHAQPQTTARYAHLADNPLKALSAEIGAAIRRRQRKP